MDNEVFAKLTNDLKPRIEKMTRDEARFLIDAFYQMQDNRIRSDNQIRSVGEESHKVLDWLSENSTGLEKQINSALLAWAESQHMGRWAMGVFGIKHVLAAGLLAHIDIEKAPTVGHIWRFAGLDPTCKWYGKEGAKEIVERLGFKEKITEGDIERAALEINTKSGLLRNRMKKKGEDKYSLTKTCLQNAIAKCPWNEALKKLCWKIGESFVKVSNNPKDVYGKLYQKRKVYEQSKNEAGDYKAQAEAVLEKKKTHAQRDVYKEGKLPDGHIHSRAKRYAVKQFLADWFGEAYRDHFKKEPPNPYPIAILGHAHERKAA